MTYKKVAIVEKIYYTGTVGDKHVAFLCEDIFTSKNKLQQFLDMLASYGTVKLIESDNTPIDIKTIWRGKEFGFIDYIENGTKFEYRIRMKELDRVH